MRTLIKASVVHPVTSAPIGNGFVAIDGGLIESCGSLESIDEKSFGEVIELSNHILLPGFINSHSHLHLSGLRDAGISYNASFSGWIREVIAYLQSSTMQERQSGVKAGIEEMILSGITSIADISPSAEAVEPLLASDINSLVFIEAIAPYSDDAGVAFERVKHEVERVIAKGGRAGISPHAPHTVSSQLLLMIKEYAQKNSLPLTMHIAETGKEVELLQNGTGEMAELFKSRGGLPEQAGRGVTPIEFVESAGLLSNLLAVHLNCLSDDDIKLLIEKKSLPVFCPSSSKWFGRESLMPFDKFIDAGLKPTIGTDSLASNLSLSMLDELRTAKKFFPLLSLKTFIECATINPASALGFNAGAIEAGRQADLIAFELVDGGSLLDSVFKAKKADFVFIAGSCRIPA